MNASRSRRAFLRSFGASVAALTTGSFLAAGAGGELSLIAAMTPSRSISSVNVL